MTGMPDVGDLPAFMFPHQRDIVAWALRRGRSAIFAGTGLGKTAMELVWGDRVASYTGKPVLIFAPLAVSLQHIREAGKFGLSARIVKDQSEVGQGVNVTNYQKIGHFDLAEFGGVCLDESSILKSVDGHYRTRLIEECATIPFRLAATATPAPNDFMELGNHAEFLGVMSYTDMLATFFIHDGGDTQKWRLKGHAENEFWKWMASWAVMLRKPSDLGYPNDGYDLPPLVQNQHVVGVDYAPSLDTGLLFPMEASSLQERIAARRDTVEERVKMAVSIVIGSYWDKLAECLGNQNTQLTDAQKLSAIQKEPRSISAKLDRWVVWCHLNSEQDALEKAFGSLALSIRGSKSDEENERSILAFLEGEQPILIGKPSMMGFGLNLQCCHQTLFVGLNDSFEQVFQAIRRFWRFGQTKPVNVHFIAAETEGAVVANLKRKEADAERMAAAMVHHMADLSSATVRGIVRDRPDYNPTKPVILPEFLRAA